MFPTIPTRSAIVSCLLMFSSGVAMGGMYECVDPAGATTYTDMPCKDGDDRIRPAGAIRMVTMNKRQSPYGAQAAAKQAARGKAVDRKPQQRGFSTDRATLQAASDAIMTSERVSALEPRQSFSRNY